MIINAGILKSISVIILACLSAILAIILYSRSIQDSETIDNLVRENTKLSEELLDCNSVIDYNLRATEGIIQDVQAQKINDLGKLLLALQKQQSEGRYAR